MQIIQMQRIFHRTPKRIAGIDISNVTLEPGFIYAIIGPNGSGKTTMLRCLAGLLDFSGIIHVGEVSGTRSYLRDLSVYLDQFPERNVFSHLTIDQNLALADHKRLGLGFHRVPHGAIRLADFAHGLRGADFIVEGHKSVDNLSGGQIQLLSLVMALLAGKSLLLLDEFLANLDPPRRKQMTLTLHDLTRRERLLIIYVSHNIAESITWCDYIIALNLGRLQGQFTAEEFRRLSEHDLEALFA